MSSAITRVRAQEFLLTLWSFSRCVGAAPRTGRAISDWLLLGWVALKSQGGSSVLWVAWLGTSPRGSGRHWCFLVSLTCGYDDQSFCTSLYTLARATFCLHSLWMAPRRLVTSARVPALGCPCRGPGDPLPPRRSRLGPPFMTSIILLTGTKRYVRYCLDAFSRAGFGTNTALSP